MSNNILKSANLYGKTLFPKVDKPEICRGNCCEKSRIFVVRHKITGMLIGTTILLIFVNL